mgnify:FL=1
MMKRLFQSVLALFSSYTGAALASWGEFGEQLMVPGFKTTSAYDTLGATKYVFVAAITADGAYSARLATDSNSSTLLGVLQNGPAVGEAMSIACAGVSKVVAGAAIAANAIITTNGSGRAVTVTSGDMAAGRALEAADADGDVITAMLFHPVRWGQVA